MRSLIPIVVICLSGIVLLFIATSQWGIGYDPDSIIYEDAAENWHNGYGVTRYDFATGERYPLTNFPPLYPITLSLLSQFIGTVAQAARWLNLALWAITAFLAYMLIQRSRYSREIAWGGTALLMLNFFVLQVYGTSWSEPLFIVLGYGGLSLLLNFHEHHQASHLWGAGVLFSLATLTRYAGVALVLTALVVIWMQHEKPFIQRTKQAIIFALITGVPLALWFLRNIGEGASVANREVAFHPIGLSHLQTTLETVANWLLPIPILGYIMLGIVGLLLALSWQFSRNTLVETDRVNRILLLWIGIYALFLIASASFADERIPFNYRLLLPAYIAVVIVVGRWLNARFVHWAKGLRRAWIMMATILFLLNGMMALYWTATIHANGHQYSSRIFQESDALAKVRVMPQMFHFVSNNNFMFHYYTNRPAVLLPYPDSASVQAWLDAIPTQEIANIRIVYFHWPPATGWESADQLQAMLPLTLVTKSPEVNVYTLNVLGK